MTDCTSIDLKAYSLDELERRERASVEEHLRACDGCREELQRLDLTKAALGALPDEEIPQRIAFVSDAVFEPRWWQRLWSSGPVMGFASALVLAAAILGHGAMRPAPVGGPVVMAGQTHPTETQQLQTQQTREQIDDQVQAAVAKAVSQIEQRRAEENVNLLDAAEKRFSVQHRAEMITAQETIRMYQQQAGRMLVAYNNSQNGTGQ